MYRPLAGKLVGIGAACLVPEACQQALERYPAYVDQNAVANYCALDAQGKGGAVEKQCLQALLQGEWAAKTYAPTGTECDDDADCDRGMCEDGFCHALPVARDGPTWWLIGVSVTVAAATLYYLTRSKR